MSQRKSSRKITVKEELVDLPEGSQKIKEALLENLSLAIQIPTVSYDANSTPIDYSQFDKLHTLIHRLFPLVHSTPGRVTVTKVGYSLIYEYCSENETEKPILLCAHQDVVPVADSTRWNHDPFSGFIDSNEVVWGRGSIDDKHSLMSLLYMMETFLSEGGPHFNRRIIAAFGHDEEIGGLEGAQKLSGIIQSRLAELGHEKLEFILDEGTFVLNKVFPGFDTPLAFVGMCEKGNMTVKIRVNEFPAAHSSMPSNGITNLTILGDAIKRLEMMPFPFDFRGLETLTEPLLKLFPVHLRIIFSNINLLRPFFNKFIAKKPAMAAMLRTSTAITVFRSGEKLNVIPGEAVAYIQHRVHPNVFDDIDPETSPEEMRSHLAKAVLDYDRKVINDERVKIELTEDLLEEILVPSPLSSTENATYNLFQEVVGESFAAVTSPTLLIGNTDTRHYWKLSDNVYRFTPVVFDKIDDTKMFHGDNERVSGTNLLKQYLFFRRLVERVGSTEIEG
eukprot:augustus_masked-scaffold_1-processed-gene-31.58-mRNA-1 protein AED:0.00 eAED:0.03 QI:0/-1/0/1/-1/1/1/0/504